MRYLRALIARIAGMFTRSRADAELAEELASHLAMETEENVRRGMTPAEARRRALLVAGGLTQAAEAVRDRRGLPWLEHLAADLRYAWRTLGRSPVFTAVVVITLALGIGANTAIFSVVRGVLLKPLPNRDGDQLVYLRHSTDTPGGEDINFSVPEVGDFRAGAPAFSGIAEFCPFFATLQGERGATRIQTGLVTGNFFEVMGLSAVLGRLTTSANDGPGVPPVAVLPYDFWIRRFGADSAIVGKTLRVDGNVVTIIGVLQPAPSFPEHVDVWMNMVVSPHHLSAQMVQDRVHRMTEIVGRLKPGVTLDGARAQVLAVDQRMQRDNAAVYDPTQHYRVTVVPYKQAIGQRSSLTLWLLMAAAAFVLVIASANVGNLTLMRGVRREPELVARAALGAGAGRLRRLLLAENLLLAVVGAALGVVLAVFGVRLLTALVARTSPRADEIHIDWMVLGFTFGVAVLLALALSFVASLPREGSFGAWITAGGRRVSGGRGTQRLQRALVVVQVAVSVVLLAGAGLLTRTMIRLSDVATGLSTEQVLTVQAPLKSPTQFLADPNADTEVKQNYELIRGDILALPGVKAVGLGSAMPLTTPTLSLDFDLLVEGYTPPAGAPPAQAEIRTAGPEYFDAAGIPLIRGRGIAVTDAPGAGHVAVVNQTFVAAYFPHEDPIGRQVRLTGPLVKFSPYYADWRTIVGVVGDTRDGGLDAAPRAEIFFPFAQEPAFFGGLVVRTDSNVAALINPVTRILRRVAPDAAIEKIATVTQLRDESLAPRRLNAELISSFSLLALIIAAVGIAGVLAFSVSTRTNEIGIRMSLGADGVMVQRMVLGEGGRLLVLGLLLGIAGAYFTSGLIRGLLFGIPPRDPTTFLSVATMMGAIGLLACWIPALRASRIDPAVTMRSA